MTDQWGDHDPRFEPTRHAHSQQPKSRHTTLIIACAAAAIALLIAAGAIVVAVLKSNDDAPAEKAADTPVSSQSSTLAPAPSTVTETRTQTTVVPQQVPDSRSALADRGYVYSCTGSNVLRMSTETQCGWAQNVAQVARTRGAFSGVTVYSPHLGRYVPTTCTDEGAWYICQGQTNNTIAVPK